MTFGAVFQALSTIFTRSAIDALTLFLPLFIFGGLLYFLSQWTRNSFKNCGLERVDIYVTGIIGVPVHEIGHLLFCIIFGHTVTRVSLFKPNAHELGSIEHSFQPKNIYHRVGNFFIAIGPILFGSALLWVLAYFLLDHSWFSFQHSLGTLPHDEIALLYSIPQRIIHVATRLYAGVDFGMPQPWLFIYFSMSIASHMALSPSDLAGMRSGLITLVLVIVVIHVVLFFTTIQTNAVSILYTYSLIPFFTYSMFALAISFCSFCGVFMITTLISLITRRRLINPLR